RMIKIHQKTCLAFLVYALCDCSHAPIITEPLINSQTISENKSNLKFAVQDDRDEQFKTQKCFVFERKFPAFYLSCGDLIYDLPIGNVFEKMLIRRFGNNADGYKTEVKLKAFYHTQKPHDLSAVPFVGLFTI